MPEDGALARPGGRRADAAPREGFATRMAHLGRAGTHAHGFVNPPLHRGSTVLHPDVAARREFWAGRHDRVLSYGIHGGPTHHALEDVVADIEGGSRCFLVGSGLAAVAVPLTAYLKAGDHCLMPDSVYGPARVLCDGLLRGWGIETTYHDPCVDADGLRALIRPNTRVLYLESPGSHTFEIQDVPTLAAVARGAGLKVLMDNTWGLHHFQPFRHGVDVSIQALTKYVVGHSDVLLGGITVNDEADWRVLREAGAAMGHYASPDDCWLALRGARTLAVRLARQERSALEVARWLEGRPEVERVVHPALPSHPQHALWRRDFTGACSLFGVAFRARYAAARVNRMVDGLELFGIGASWGGFESLALPTTGFVHRTALPMAEDCQMVRLHVGLEEPADLIADLARGLDGLDAPLP